MINETQITEQQVEAQPIPEILYQPATTFQITLSRETVTGGYLWRSDVEPVLTQNTEGVYTLCIRNQGTHGKFDLPYISTLIPYVDESLVVTLTAYHGTETFGRKNDQRVSKGQFWRFYVCNDDGVWARVNWKQLDEDQRKTVLSAHKEDSVPEWVRAPGKLGEDYKTPRHARTKMTSYKIVRVVDGRYYSVFKPDEEYILGQLKKEPAKRRHGGGYYSYPTQAKLLEMFHDHRLFDYSCYKHPMTLALIDCEISGRIIEYNNGKWASTFLRPLSVLSTWEYSPN
jgi:hypothetical protein